MVKGKVRTSINVKDTQKEERWDEIPKVKTGGVKGVGQRERKVGGHRMRGSESPNFKSAVPSFNHPSGKDRPKGDLVT